jgi:hypothetical protein
LLNEFKHKYENDALLRLARNISPHAAVFASPTKTNAAAV